MLGRVSEALSHVSASNNPLPRYSGGGLGWGFSSEAQKLLSEYRKAGNGNP